MTKLKISSRPIGLNSPPLVIAEIGINHEGDIDKAIAMVDAAVNVGCECVKFQCHVVEDEMTAAARNVIPANAKESIWDIMSRCALSEEQEREIQQYCKELGIIYLSTPFSRAAADRLESMNVPAYKIGSGEFNNIPLIKHIASYGKPMILSCGMNSISSVEETLSIVRQANVPHAIMHCTSMYPTPYSKVRLGALKQLIELCNCPIGLSDHSIGIWTCLGAVAIGASILEKHFTSDKNWPGPDMPISIDPGELKNLIEGSKAIWEASGGQKDILPEEKATIDFAYASVCAIANIKAGESLTMSNIWAKRPGTGAIPAREFESLLGRKAARNIAKDALLKREDIE